MAFGAAPSFTAAGARSGQTQYNILEVSVATALLANVAAAPDRANADTGALTSNTGAIDAVPANTSSMPSGFGKGPDDWTQTDVDALTVIPQDDGVTVTKLSVSKALVANVNPAPSGSSISNANAEVLIQNLGAGATGTASIRIIAEHTAIR